MWSACLDEYQHAVGRHCDLVLSGGDWRVLVLAQGFLDLLFDFEQGGVQCGSSHFNFWKVGNMGGAAVCRECAKHRIRLVLDGNVVLHPEHIVHQKILTRKSESVLIHSVQINGNPLFIKKVHQDFPE